MPGVTGNPYVRAEGGQTLLLGGLLNNFGCSTWNETAETGLQYTVFRFADTADASVIGYYATEYDPDCRNATVAVWRQMAGHGSRPTALRSLGERHGGGRAIRGSATIYSTILPSLSSRLMKI